MPSIYISKKTKEKLDKFINSSRISPQFGAKNKYPSPDKAIEFLLKIGLKLPLESLEKIAKQPLVEFKIEKMSDKEFEDFEKSGKLKLFVEEKLREKEE